MSFAKYSWAANRIADNDMAALHRMKTDTGRPITRLVAEAVSAYVKKEET